MTETSYQAIVLAASRGPDDPMAQAFAAKHKCLIDIAGTPMIERVIDALLECKRITGIYIAIESAAVVAGNAKIKALIDAGRVRVIASKATASESVLHAAEVIGDYPLLVTTADHALLTAAMADDFLSRSDACGASVTVGLASSAVILTAYPESKRTWLKFADEKYSGCNLFALRDASALKVIWFWRGLERQRKNPWQLARAFGLKFLWLYLSGKLSLDQAFALASKRLGSSIHAVKMTDAHAAIDVDKPADKELVEQILAG